MSEWYCICVRCINFPFSTLFLLDLGTVPSVVFFGFFNFIEQSTVYIQSFAMNGFAKWLTFRYALNHISI